jgi:hypothetical protein
MREKRGNIYFLWNLCSVEADKKHDKELSTPWRKSIQLSTSKGEILL